MRKFILALMGLLVLASTAMAQNLPAGSIGTVTNNTANTWQPFSYTFTPSTTGSNFIGFAFRQDPAFWTFDNVRLVASGSTTNLLTNGAFDNGGSFSVTTSNGPSSIQAPTNWGVWYQNGTFPAAAGAWQTIGGSHGGVWYDGAVGSFDGIYQGVALTAGTTYTISFEVSGNNVANTSSIQLGIYGGACSTVSIAPGQCTIPSSVGFTTLATPSQGAAAGNPTPPPVTLVSTANAPSTATSSTAYGTSVVAYNVGNARVNSGQWIAVTRTTTPVTTRPFTITTVTTPHAVETYSDGTTVTTNGTVITTTQNGATVTVGQPVAQTASVSSVSLKDMLAVRNFNPFLVDVFSTKDGAWATPLMGYAKTDGGSFNTSSIGFGAQKTFENNTLGIAGTFGKSGSKNFLNSESNSDSYGATVYALNKQSAIWTKVAVGFSSSEYTTSTSLPVFALVNSNKVKANNYYADLTFYSGKEFRGFRPLVGVTLNKSGVVSQSESGSPLLSTLPEKDSTFEARPYAGVRYDIDWFGIETRVTQSKDFKTVGQVRASVKKEVFKNVSVDVTGGFDKSSNYTAAVGMVGLKINF